MSAARSDSDDLFFTALVRSYVQENPRFLRRDWLAALIDEKLREAGCRFLLLTAEPGAGKSVFMAQLAHDHPEWLRYFIRRDQRSMLADVSSKSLLLRIGYQLAARRPDLFSADQLRLSVTQRIGETAAQGEVIGAEVERLTASPFYQTVLRIEQHVGVNQGRTVGLRVEELTVEARLLPVEDLLDLAIIHPARALKRIDPRQPIVILVDALDEIRYHQSTEDVLGWLTHCPELPENVRFVLTSRPPDEALELFCAKQAPYLATLGIAEDDPLVKSDIEQFVATLVGEKKLAELLRRAEGGATVFAEEAVERAHGNLGYVDALARGIDQACGAGDSRTIQALLTLKRLPRDLEGLYAFFLLQIKRELDGQQIVGKDSARKIYSADVWPAVYEPVLGVLAVAVEPLEPDLIAAFGDIVDPKWARPALNRLRQFLDVVDGKFHLYHATVAEFLTDETTRRNPKTAGIYVDAQHWHRAIAEHCIRKYGQDWLACSDRYALAYTPAHLAEAGRQARESGERRRLLDERLRLLTTYEFVEAATRIVGVESVLGALHQAQSAVPSSTRVTQLAGLLDRERHLLTARDVNELPAFFPQQILNRAKDQGAEELARKALDRLAGLGRPYLELRWRTRRQSPALITTFVGHEESVIAVVAVEDGSSALSGSADGMLRVWSLSPGKTSAILAHTRPVVALQLASDRRQVIVATQHWGRWGIELRDAGTGALAATLAEEQVGEITSLVLTPDGKQILAGFQSGHLSVWDLVAKERTLDLPGREASVLTIAVTRDGTRTVTGFADSSVEVRELTTGSVICRVAGLQEPVTKLAVTQDGARIICGSNSGHLTVYDLGTGKEVLKLAGHAKPVTALAMAPDGVRVVSGSADSTLKLWDIASGSLLGTLTGHQLAVRAVAFANGGKHLLSGSDDGTLALWDLEAASTPFVPTGHDTMVTSLAVSDTGRFVISGSRDGTIKVQALDDGAEIETFIDAEAGSTIVVSPWGSAAASCSEDGAVRWWDLASGEGRLEMELSEPATAIAVDSAGFVVSTNRGAVIRRDFDGSDSRYDLSGRDSFMAVHSLVGIPPDGLRVAYAGYRQPENAGETGLLDLRTGEHEWLGYNEKLMHNVVVVTADGHYLLSGCERGMIRVWDLRANRELPCLTEADDVLALAIQQNADRLVAGLFGRKVVVRSLKGLKLEAAAAVEAAVTAVDVHQGSNLIVVGDVSGNLYCYSFVDGRGQTHPGAARPSVPSARRGRRHSSAARHGGGQRGNRGRRPS